MNTRIFRLLRCGQFLAGLLCCLLFKQVHAVWDEVECQPEYRSDVDTRTVVAYQGSLQYSAKMDKDKCEHSEGLIVAYDHSMDGSDVIRYLPLSYVADTKDADFKADGLAFPLDLIIKEIKDSRSRSTYRDYVINIVVRQKGSGSFFQNGDEPLVIIADKKKLQLKNLGGGHGMASYGAMSTINYGLSADAMRILLKGNSYNLILPFRHEQGEAKPFKIRLTLTNEGEDDLKKFLKVADNLTDNKCPNPGDIKDFVADPIPQTSSNKGSNFTREEMAKLLKTYRTLDRENSKNFPYIAGYARTGYFILKDGKKIKWMIKQTGLVILEFPDGKEMYLAGDKIK